jgi:hypothetical protein
MKHYPETPERCFMTAESDIMPLLSTFIADEDDALRTGRQGQFWPMKHYLVTAALSKAEHHLEPADRQQACCHYMRLSGLIPTTSDAEFPHLVTAYRKLLPMLDTRDAGLTRRHLLLFCFGFDENGALPDGVTSSGKELRNYLKLTAHCLKYSHLPGQRAKVQSFRSYAHFGERIYQTLKHLGYYCQRQYGPDNATTTDLLFWGMVLVVLLHEGRRADLVHDFLHGAHSVPRRDDHLATLNKTVQSVLSEGSIEDARFRALTEQLALRERDRRSSTEAAAFARALSLPLADDEDWQIHIVLPTMDNDANPILAPDLICSIQPDPDHQWTIQLNLGGGRHFSEKRERILQNDIRIDGLGAGNLMNMPQWLKANELRFGIRFDRERAIVRCGRNRAAAKRVMQWLAG